MIKKVVKGASPNFGAFFCIKQLESPQPKWLMLHSQVITRTTLKTPN